MTAAEKAAARSRDDYDDDPRLPVVTDIIDRLERPRFYAGNWPADQARRLLLAIDTATDAARQETS